MKTVVVCSVGCLLLLGLTNATLLESVSVAFSGYCLLLFIQQ